MADPKTSDTYRKICERLRTFNPPILLEKHIDVNHVGKDGQPTFKAEASTLGGIFFHAKNFEGLRREFVTTNNTAGERAFDYFPLRPDKIKHFFSSAFALNLLDISYLATRGYGFREIWNPVQLDDRPLSMADARPGRRAPLWDKGFGARFGEAGIGDKRRDITSVHVALLDDLCNIHIDDVGFVMRIAGVGGMTPDFGQHLVDELLWKTYLAPLISEHLGEYVTINLPSSRTGYRPSVGLTVDLPKQDLSVSATFTFKCKCLSGGRADADGIPEGYSIGVGITKRF
ncbi:MAG: hypothetical protein J0H01_05880 [Rhizobiales bacterium]|nr:hypothetical protein [Hyphomicrobiales bacterium]